jgi:RNA polymerase-binding transcription factor DksA
MSEKAYDEAVVSVFRHKLAAKKLGLLAKIQKNGDPILVEDLLANTDRLNKTAERTNLLAEKKRLVGELQDVNDALKRIADGSYGICIDCGELILLARLEAVLTAKRCMSCQVKYKKTKGVR